MISIQRILIKPTFIEQFFMKNNDDKPIKISRNKYENFYDKSWSDDNIEVLPPLTKDL